MSVSYDDEPVRSRAYAGGLPASGLLARLPERSEFDSEPSPEPGPRLQAPQAMSGSASMPPLFSQPAPARAPGVLRRDTGGWRGRLSRGMSSAASWLKGRWNALGSLFRRRSPARPAGQLAEAMRQPHPLFAEPAQEGSGAFVQAHDTRFRRWLNHEDDNRDEWAGAKSLPYSMGQRPDTPDTPLNLAPAMDLGPTPGTPGTPDAQAPDTADALYDAPFRRGSFSDAGTDLDE